MEETDGVGVVDVVVVDGVAAFAVVAVVAAVAAVDDEEEGMDSGLGGGLRLAISRFACGKTTYNDVTEKLCGHSTVFVFLKYIYIKTTAPTLSYEQIQRKKKKKNQAVQHTTISRVDAGHCSACERASVGGPLHAYFLTYLCFCGSFHFYFRYQCCCFQPGTRFNGRRIRPDELACHGWVWHLDVSREQYHPFLGVGCW